MEYYESVRKRQGVFALLRTFLGIGWLFGAMVGMTVVFWLFVPMVFSGYVVAFDLFDLSGAPEVNIVRHALFTVGLWATMATIGALVADRFGPRITKARLIDRTDPSQARVADVFDTLGLALGQSPIVYTVELGWADVAALGRRHGRPVVVTTTAAEKLDRSDLEVLAALGLADSLRGDFAARFWRGTKAMSWIPLAILRGWKLVLLVWLAQFPTVVLAIGTESLSETATALLLPVGVFLMYIYFFFVSAGSSMAMMSHLNTDLGALGLLRHPEQWRRGCRALASQRPKWSGSESVDLLDWLCPTEPYWSEVRYPRVLKALPTVGRRLPESSPSLSGRSVDPSRFDRRGR